MKQKVLLLLVLTLGMCGTTGFAQEKEYKVANDGFEWYKVTRTVNGQKKYGAEDRNGNMIIPTEYDEIWYCSNNNQILTGFLPNKGKYMAWYNKSGKCVIPYSRGYTWIQKFDSEEFGTYYMFEKHGGCGLCDKNGREVVLIKADSIGTCFPFSKEQNGNKYYFVSFQQSGKGYGIADANGKIVFTAQTSDFEVALNAAKSRVTTTNNPLLGNRHESLAEAEGRTQGGQNYPVADQQKGGGTTTVVVEHHRDPIPVQQWQACFACGGMGTMGCDNCGGGGTKYIGDRLHRCSRCNGRGIIPCNVCYGNKGQYITVYK